MSRKKNRKIVKYRTFSFFNIGTVLFGVIFLYMIICLIMYMTTDHITAYEVTAGPLSGNYRYSALALRKEEVIKADQSGNITYYTREGNKVGAGTAVCSINETRSAGVTTIAPTKASSGDGTSVNSGESSLDTQQLEKLKDEMSAFSMSFHENTFQNVYNFKGNLESTIMEISNDSQSSENYILNACTAPKEGIVVFSQDGYENRTPESVTSDDFEQKNYEKDNLRTQKSVKSGNPIYKLVTDEEWYLLIPLDAKMATELAKRTSVKFRFLKDNTTFYADFQIITDGSNSFGQLTLNKCMSQYATERYVDIELVLNRRTGLKIPNSAIAEKTFYIIPEEYASYDETQENAPSEISVKKQVTAENGEITFKPIQATVYDKVAEGFLVDCSLFDEGDMICKQDTKKTYTISETAVLQGVYNINKGYAIFREITIKDQNEEYCIVEEDSTFGLAQYDHIVLDASTVNDEDIVIHY